MANDRIKVAGYAKKVVYDGGIEYRNFSDSLVGNQFTSDGGTTLFTAANFRITTNLEPKIDKIFNTNSFGEFVNLEDLKMNHDEAVIFINDNFKAKLKFDKSELSNYAYFGSLREYMRVSLEFIIMNWPASIFVSPINEFNPALTGSTYEAYLTDSINGVSTFSVNSIRFVNKFKVNYFKNGHILDNFSDTNDLRNMAVNYGSYNISTISGDYAIIGFTGASEFNSNVYFQVSGEPFTNSATTVNYHIKPNELKIEEFFNGLDDFESNLLNRLTIPAYTSNYKYSIETELGNIIISDMTLTWPVSDGYNIDFDNESYTNFVTGLLTMADGNDLTKTNLITRFLVSESISEFDTVDQKMANTLRIYGREFDEVKKYIDGIAFANSVSYDGVNNIPDIAIKNLAKVMGWDLISSIADINSLNDYLITGENTFEGYSRGLTPIEAEVELWRRIILNTPWLWKSKGTRKAVEFLFRFIGSPDGLVSFNEFIYVAKKALDIELFSKVLEANVGNDNLEGLNIDSDGFPMVLPDTSEMYFQKAGLWYRETAGPNSNVDILTGNNPHIGPYDSGQEYINQFTCLIPDFEPVTLIEEIISTGSTNLFINYNNGIFNGLFSYNVVTSFNIQNILTHYEELVDIEIFNNLHQDINPPDINLCSGLIQSELMFLFEGEILISLPLDDYPFMYGEGFYDKDYFNETVIEAITESVIILNSTYGTNLELIVDGPNYSIVDYKECGEDSFYMGKEVSVVSLYMQYDFGCGEPPYSRAILINNFTNDSDVFDYSGSTIDINLEVVNEDGLDISDCILVEGEIIETNPSRDEFDECGCPINKCDKASLRIKISKNPPQPMDCGFKGFTLDTDGLVIFTLYDDIETKFMDSQCCSSLGYQPELQNGSYVCRWNRKDDEISCPNYLSLKVEPDTNIYQFIIDLDGNHIDEVPLVDCCPLDSVAVPTSIVNNQQYYKCVRQ